MFACIVILQAAGTASKAGAVTQGAKGHETEHVGSFCSLFPVPCSLTFPVPCSLFPRPVPCSLTRLAFCFSPRVEPVAPDTVILDMEGLERLFGPPDVMAKKISQRAAASGLQANVAIARNTEAAIYAARGFAGITVIPPGEEAKTLSSLTLHLFPALPEIQDTWKLWGLKSFGDLAALPEIGVAERLGPEGARLHRMARGAEARPLIPLIPAVDFHSSEELEHPVELLDPLSFILASLLNQVCASLEMRGLAASELQLQFKLENPPQNVPPDFERRLSLPVPLCDSTALLKLLRLDLEAHPPQASVIAISLRASPAKPRVTQNSLFIPPAPEPQKLELTLARITKLVGEGNAGSPSLVDTHRPGAFEMRPFRVSHSQDNQSRDRKGAVPHTVSDHALRSNPPLSFRVFRPPLAAEVECYGNELLQVRARGIRGKVVSFAGPWRSSGDWWTTDPWQRDEWDIELAPMSRIRRTGEVMGRKQSTAAPEGRNMLAHGISRGYASPKHPSPGGAKEVNSSEESEYICRPSGALLSSDLQLTHDSRRGLDSTAPSGAVFSQRITQRGNSLYRIYRDLRTDAWYIEGSYD